MSTQTWTVIEWGVIDAGVLGARIVCVQCCDGWNPTSTCQMCDGTGELFQPYRLPNGEAIDLDRHAEILIQIEPRNGRPS